MHTTGQQTLFCRSTSVRSGDGPSPAPPRAATPAPDIEEEASVFAAALLMPEHLLREHHARLGGNLIALCDVFESSQRAMERRIADVLGA